MKPSQLVIGQTYKRYDGRTRRLIDLTKVKPDDSYPSGTVAVFTWGEGYPVSRAGRIVGSRADAKVFAENSVAST